MGSAFSMHEGSLNAVVYTGLAVSSAVFIYYSMRLKTTNQEFLQQINSTINTVRHMEHSQENDPDHELLTDTKAIEDSFESSLNNDFSVDKEWDEFFTMERVNVPIYVALYMRAKCMEFIKVLQGKTFCSIMVDPVKTTSYHDFFYEQQPIIITGNKRYYKRAVQELNQLVNEVKHEVFVVRRGALKKMETDGKRNIISKINRSTNTLLVTYLLDDTFNADYGEDVRVVLLGREQGKFFEARDKIKRVFTEVNTGVSDFSDLSFKSDNMRSSFTMGEADNSHSDRSKMVSSPAIDMYNKFMNASLIKSVQSVHSMNKMAAEVSSNDTLRKALSSEEKIIADNKHKALRSSLVHLYSLNENLNEEDEEEKEENSPSKGGDKSLKSRILSRFKSKKERN